MKEEIKIFSDEDGRPGVIEAFKSRTVIDYDGNKIWKINFRGDNSKLPQILSLLQPITPLMGGRLKYLETVESMEELCLLDYLALVDRINTISKVEAVGVANIKPIPLPTTSQIQEAIAVPLNVETELASISGSGQTEVIIVYTAVAAASEGTSVRVYADGKLAFDRQFGTLNVFGCGASTPKVSLTAYNVNGICTMLLSIQFQFSKSLSVKAFNNTGPQVMTCDIIANLSG